MSRKDRGLKTWKPDRIVGELPDPLGQWRSYLDALLDEDEDVDLYGFAETLLKALAPAPGHNCGAMHAHSDGHPEAGVDPGEGHHHHDDRCTPTYILPPPSTGLTSNLRGHIVSVR